MNEALNDLTSEQKYSRDGEFIEPLVRCDKCQELLFVKGLKKLGACTRCGNTRVSNVRVLTEPEMNQAKAWVSEGRLDNDWVKLFEVMQ